MMYSYKWECTPFYLDPSVPRVGDDADNLTSNVIESFQEQYMTFILIHIVKCIKDVIDPMLPVSLIIGSKAVPYTLLSTILTAGSLPPLPSLSLCSRRSHACKDNVGL